MKVKNIWGDEIDYNPCHDNDVWIASTDEEKTAAIRVGKGMREFSRDNGHKVWDAKDTSDAQMMRNQCLGELCQMLACKALGVPIHHRPQSYGNAPDIGDNVQVRSIGAEWYGLRIKEKDQLYWRVVGIVVPRGQERAPRHRCPGWFYVYEARQHREWWIEPWGPPPMLAVPQKFLRPLSELEL